jgi:16S rRNA (guanine966-N2)-methyltransferase
MRIVSGLHRGRPLKTPRGADIRPTSDKVRQALFNALRHRGAVEDAVVLDAFCGTGAMGLEALSQGAAHCVFMDLARSSLDLARQNVALLKEEARSAFILKDATKPGQKPEGVPPATLLFLDPPYHKNLVPQAFKALLDHGWLAAGCLVVAEAEKDADLSGLPECVEFERSYGDTLVTVRSL